MPKNIWNRLAYYFDESVINTVAYCLYMKFEFGTTALLDHPSFQNLQSFVPLLV